MYSTIVRAHPSPTDGRQRLPAEGRGHRGADPSLADGVPAIGGGMAAVVLCLPAPQRHGVHPGRPAPGCSHRRRCRPDGASGWAVPGVAGQPTSSTACFPVRLPVLAPSCHDAVRRSAPGSSPTRARNMAAATSPGYWSMPPKASGSSAPSTIRSRGPLATAALPRRVVRADNAPSPAGTRPRSQPPRTDHSRGDPTARAPVLVIKIVEVPPRQELPRRVH